MARKNPDEPDPQGQMGLMLEPLPWWAKTLIGVCGLVIIYKYTPIFELLSLFFYVFVVPMCAIGFTIFGMNGALAGLLTTWNKAKIEIQTRVQQKVQAAA
jgi:hypothetical protein